jgi:hypothetical protein
MFMIWEKYPLNSEKQENFLLKSLAFYGLAFYGLYLRSKAARKVSQAAGLCMPCKSADTVIAAAPNDGRRWSLVSRRGKPNG